MGEGLKLTESKSYYAVVLFLFLLNISILLPPFLIFAGQEGTASTLYNLHSYDHQWIYRSQCIFKDSGESMILDDCIVQGKEGEADISTLYTKNGDPLYNGVFLQYPQSQIGINKAEKVERNGMVGYKFANDTRDYAIYLPMLLTMVANPYIFGPGRKDIPHWIWFVLALVPLGIDGTTQLFGLRESTNLLRWLTGAIAGIAAGHYIVPLLNLV